MYRIFSHHFSSLLREIANSNKRLLCNSVIMRKDFHLIFARDDLTPTNHLFECVNSKRKDEIMLTIHNSIMLWFIISYTSPGFVIYTIYTPLCPLNCSNILLLVKFQRTTEKNFWKTHSLDIQLGTISL